MWGPSKRNICGVRVTRLSYLRSDRKKTIMTKPCIFCGKPGGSREHLWSDALDPEIARHLPKDHKRSFKSGDSRSGVDVFKQHGMPLYATTIPCVCHSCNNSWMNRLDERTRVKTVRLIRGQEANYDLPDTTYLASWLAMKMIVRDEYEFTRSAFSSADKVNFYLTGLPPPNMWIGIALCGASTIWAGAFHRQYVTSLTANTAGNLTQTVHASYTMGLGATVAFVEYPIAGTRPAGIPDDQVLTIWPKPAPFSWPARRELSWSEVRRISMRFDPARESAGDMFGRSQLRMATPPQNRHSRRSQRKGKQVR